MELINTVDFSQVKMPFLPPDLLEVQKNSFNWFKNVGLRELLDEFNNSDELTTSDKVIIEFVSYEFLEPSINPKECKERGKIYGGILKLTVKITFKDTGEIKEQTISLGEVPFMTPTGSFIINGIERVVIGQLTRSPGVYFEVEPYSSGKFIHKATIIPDRGSWLEFETDPDGTVYIHLDKKSKKILATTVLKALGLTDDDLKSIFTQEIIVNVDTHSENFLNSQGKILAEDIYDFETGEDLYKSGTIINSEIITKISQMPINNIKIIDKGILGYIKSTLEKDDLRDQEEAKKLIFMRLHPGERYTPENADKQFRMVLTDPRRNDLGEVGRYKINKKLNLNLEERTVTSIDIIEIIKYFSKIDMGKGKTDNRDHLGNKRVRLVGELLKNSMRIGFIRVIKFMLEKIAITPEEEISVQTVMNVRPLIATINEFFGLGQLSQFMDETNPIASLTHKRRVSSLGPGGLHRERAGAEVRDIHHSHYGRLCPIETPEGENIGLINSLTVYSKIDKFGFIVSPYFKVENGKVSKDLVYITADDEEKSYIAQANTSIDDQGNILTDKCVVRFEGGDVKEVSKEEVEYIDISPMQVFSASANLIPFLENDDANRALMGCNMEHQAIPLIFPEAPLVETGLEKKIAIDSGADETAKEKGVISYVDSSKISISSIDNGLESVKIGHLNKELLNQVLAENILQIAKIGEIIDGVLINKLIKSGVESIKHFDSKDQEILDENTISRFVGTSIKLKNDEIVGLTSSESVLRKSGKPIVRKGQKITDTILSRLIAEKIQKINVEDFNGKISEKDVFTEKVVREETLPKDRIIISSDPIIDSDIYGKTLDIELLEDLKQKGIIRLSLINKEKIKESTLFILNKKLYNPVIIGKDIKSGSKLFAKKGEVLTREILSNLINASINEIEICKEKDYILDKFRRTNQDTVINKYPLVKKNDYVKEGDIIINGEACDRGHLALGRNLLVAYLPWRGWNYQDAIVISERVVIDDLLTSLHIKEYKVSIRNTKVGPEEVTRDIPNVPEDQLRNLDENGIIRIGTEVGPNDILVGKITPKAESEFTPEMKLWRAMFDKKGQDVKDSSLRVSPGDYGTIINVQVLARDEEENLPIGVNKIIKVYIGEKRKVQVGDKLSGRHGNKGVISRILPLYDMPFLEDGTPVDIVLNPLGVPSRMNVGQILEALLGLVARSNNYYSVSPSFVGASTDQVLELLKEAGFENEGKMRLYDGSTGEPFDNKVTVGYAYIMKLNHMVEDKIHARSTGPYALITQQPLGGKAQFGGQRFGEMEVWALEAYGAAYTLQEILTIKSDDTEGRLKAFEAICQRKLVPRSNNPESFKVIISELQGLGIKMDLVEQEEEKEKEEIVSGLFSSNLESGGTL